MGLLVLTRKKSESIVIGDGLATITVVQISGDRVRIGIQAPRELPVHRFEVAEAIKKSGQPARVGRKGGAK